MAKHLPIPDEPLRDLLHMMYKEPGQLDFAVKQRKAEVLGADFELRPLVEQGGEDAEPVWGKSLSPRLRSKKLRREGMRPLISALKSGAKLRSWEWFACCMRGAEIPQLAGRRVTRANPSGCSSGKRSG